MHQDTVQLDVAVVHDEVLRHEAFEVVAVDDIEGTVLAQASHQVLYAALVGFPLLDVALDLHLGV